MNIYKNLLVIMLLLSSNLIFAQIKHKEPNETQDLDEIKQLCKDSLKKIQTRYEELKNISKEKSLTSDYIYKLLIKDLETIGLKSPTPTDEFCDDKNKEVEASRKLLLAMLELKKIQKTNPVCVLDKKSEPGELFEKLFKESSNK